VIPRWTDLRAVVALKTFYVALVLVLLSLALFGIWVGFDDKSAALAQAVLALAIALATSSTISLLSEMALRLDIVRLVTSELATSLATRDRATVVEFHESRRGLDCPQVAREASGTLRVIGISANDILAVQPLDVLGRRVQSGDLRLHVLLLDPRSAAGHERSAQSAYGSADSMGSRVQGIASHLVDLAGDLRSSGTTIEQFDARYLDRSPMLSAIIDESRAIVTPLVANLTGGRSPYFVVSADGPQGYLYRIYRSHFEELWAQGSSFL